MIAHIICYEGAGLVEGFSSHPRLILVIPHRNYIQKNLNTTEEAYLAVEKQSSIYGKIGIYTTEIWLDLQNKLFYRSKFRINKFTENEINDYKNIEITSELFRDLNRLEKNRNYNQSLINNHSKNMFDKIYPDSWINLTNHRLIRKAKIFNNSNCPV